MINAQSKDTTVVSTAALESLKRMVEELQAERDILAQKLETANDLLLELAERDAQFGDPNA